MAVEATRQIIQTNAPPDCPRIIDPVLSADGAVFGTAEVISDGKASFYKFQCMRAATLENNMILPGNIGAGEPHPACRKCNLGRGTREFNTQGEPLMIG